MFHRMDSFFLLLVLVCTGTTNGQDCNICGDGNVIGLPKSVVSFEYEGSTLKNSCYDWQQVVKNINAISDDFCRNEMFQYTKDACGCSLPDGDLLSDLSKPTNAPTTSSARVESPTSGDDASNADTTTVVNKCEQASGNDKNCDENEEEEEVNKTSSATNKLYMPAIFAISLALLAFV